MCSYRILKNLTHVKVKLTSLSSPAKEVGRTGTRDGKTLTPSMRLGSTMGDRIGREVNCVVILYHIFK